MQPYEVVSELEKRVADYAGAPYAVAVDSCSNALLLSLAYRFTNGWPKTVSIPKYTYVGVAQAILNAGGNIVFRNEDWQGEYKLMGVKIIDAARRFKKGMYSGRFGNLYCVSAHWGKTFKIGRGGFILTDDEEAADTLRRMRFDGRMAGVPPKQDDFIRGYHCYMLPEEAARGLMLMSYMPDDNPDIPWDDYADLSQYPIFRGNA